MLILKTIFLIWCITVSFANLGGILDSVFNQTKEKITTASIVNIITGISWGFFYLLSNI